VSKNLDRRKPKTPASRWKKHQMGWCYIHNKALFASRKVARRVVRDYPNSGMREYACEHVAGFFHIGHLPQVVRDGLLTTREVYGRDDV